jgi:chromosome segregation ATPase
VTDTPQSGILRKPATDQPPTDKFQLALLVTRLEAEIAVLKGQVDCLNESDEEQDKKILALEQSLTDLKKQVAVLIVDIKAWRKEALARDEAHSKRLHAIELRISGFGSLLVLVQIVFEAWKNAHGH